MIPKVDNCKSCHAPAATFGHSGGVRHDCAECHRYHNGDRPLQGLGAARRDPIDPLTLSDWLKGKKQP